MMVQISKGWLKLKYTKEKNTPKFFFIYPFPLRVSGGVANAVVLTFECVRQRPSVPLWLVTPKVDKPERKLERNPSLRG